MPSSSFVLTLCFISFLCGQLFSAFCASFSFTAAPVKTVALSVVHSGVSFRTLILVVGSALLVHDVLVVLLVCHLIKAHKPKARRNTTIVKLLLTATSAIIPVKRDNPPSALLLSAPVRGRARHTMSFSYRSLALFSIPCPLRFRPILAPSATFPLIEYPTSLALVISGGSRPPACFPRLVGLQGFRDRAWLSYLTLWRSVVAAAALRLAAPHPIVRQAVEDDSEDTWVVRVELGRRSAIGEITDDDTQPEQAEVETALRRPSHLPLLGHLSATAKLRKARVRVLVDDPCSATIEEVNEDVSATLFVEGSSTPSDPEQEKLGPPAIDQGDEAIEAGTVFEWDDLPSYEAFVLGAPPLVKSLSTRSSVKEEKIAGPTANDYGEDGETVDAVTLSDESIWDDLPSYEEFLKGAPPDPIFATRDLSSLSHGSSLVFLSSVALLTIHRSDLPPPSALHARGPHRRQVSLWSSHLEAPVTLAPVRSPGVRCFCIIRRCSRVCPPTWGALVTLTSVGSPGARCPA
ncbi:hypothetical protein DFH07DRAFT_854606 [Mycena maculata]|uniref:Transmembrane protein n=1 Tax=Mycena maculata TaxID=230809 RepID=A0AAD7MNC5_9AGAR|nr:hypothetical protein DFH07DRAFT_854606 [Mycena maculata]